GDDLGLRQAKALAQEPQRRGLVALDTCELEVVGRRSGDVQPAQPAPPGLGQERLEGRRRGNHDQLRCRGSHAPVQVADDVHLHARVLGVDVRFGPVPVHDQLVVAVGLDVEPAFARIADDLHREVMRHSMVEQRLPVERAHLGGLVADDRAGQAQPRHPGQRARIGPAGAGDDRDTGADQPVHGVDVAWIQRQVHGEDRAVQVQGKEFVSEGYRYRLTSGLTRLGGLPPRTAVAMLRAAIADISERVRTVALAMCGASTTLGIAIRWGWTAGSRSYTSRPAPASFPALSASTSAASSTTGPRDVLTRIAVRFMALNCGVLKRWCVSCVRGTWMEMKSDSAIRRFKSTRVAPSCSSASRGSGWGS